MHMMNIRRAFTGTLPVLLTLIMATTPTAQAAPHHTAAPHPHMATICDSGPHGGHRGQPAYDHACLTTGTTKDASHLWDRVDLGKRGQEHDNDMTQRGLCKYAARHGGIMASAADLVADMTYDNYRNNDQVDRWVGQDATLTCAQLGYRI